jgi:glycosyltransferase involved in cell wall biosynthesis
MGRLLMAALRSLGHEVEIASRWRAFLPTAQSTAWCDLEAQARAEAVRLEQHWAADGRPDLWFSYHPYYKAPDLIGPELARGIAIPYVTAEASYAGKRDRDGWASMQARVVAAVKLAAVNLCFTRRDRDGLVQAAPDAIFADLKPFIDAAPFIERPASSPPLRLVAVAMMRQGDKLRSFTMLAQALKLIEDVPWHLTIVGDGPARGEIEALFKSVDPKRITWAGEVAPQDVRRFLDDSDLHVWPGCGEAYGLAYLEAEAAGLPVVAQNTAGVPEVVNHGATGILTPEGNIAAYAGAIRHLLANDGERNRMSMAARQFVHRERSLAVAAAKIEAILKQRVPR